MRIARDREANVYSQFGEDGIVAEIFRHIGEGNKVACEFGAWDGKYCSNVAALIDRGWKALLIEGSVEKFQELMANYRDNHNVVMHCAYVETQGDNSLDQIFSKTSTPEPDFLSVDIDGDDYWVLSGLRMRPRVICVEFNPTFGPWHPYVNPKGANHGSAMASFVALMCARNYGLVYATYCNLFFVRTDQQANLAVVSPASVFQGVDDLTVIGSFFDGGNVMVGAGTNRWTAVANGRAFQPPRWLRSWPQSRWRVFLQQLLYDPPMSILRRIRRKLLRRR